MRPFIFEFSESPSNGSHDYSLIVYDDKLNLSVNRLTGEPAIEALNMETETFTKTNGESSDSDRNSLNSLIDTETHTFNHTETSDSDKDTTAIVNLMDTTTLTESSETTDKDRSNNAINYYTQN